MSARNMMSARMVFVAAMLVLAPLVLAPVGVAAQTPAPRPTLGEPRPFRVPGTERFTLANGLTVTLAPYGETPKTTVRLVLPTGSIDEGTTEGWLAALTADLIQEGTTGRSAEDIATEAASMGGSVVIGVGADRTSVEGDVLEEFGPDLVALMADLVRNPAFPEAELARLQGDRVRALTVALQQPGTVTQAEFVRRLYAGHPYGRPLPTAEGIRGFTVDRIRTFWATHYGPDGAHLYVSGRFDPEAMRDSIERALGSWSAAPDAAPPSAEPEPTRGVVFIQRPGAPQSTVYLGLPVVDPSHPDYVALQVTNTLLGGAFASRITLNIREDKGYTYSPQSFVTSRYRTAYWLQTADVGSEVTGAALQEIRNEIERLREEPPGEAELQGIKNYLSGIFVLQNSSRAGIIGQLAYLDLHGLPPEYLTRYVERVQAVTPEEVRRITRTYLRPEDMLLVVTGDPRVALPQLGSWGAVEVIQPPAP